MASLATYFEDDFSQPAREPVQAAVSHEIRSFPNEHIYLHRKRIDNAPVEPRTDPRFLASAWRMLTAALFVVILGLGLAAPGAYRFVTGMQIQTLEKELRAEQSRRRVLALEHGRLTSPAVLAEKGKTGYTPANPRNDIHLPQAVDPRFNALRHGSTSPKQ